MAKKTAMNGDVFRVPNLQMLEFFILTKQGQGLPLPCESRATARVANQY